MEPRHGALRRTPMHRAQSLLVATLSVGLLATGCGDATTSNEPEADRWKSQQLNAKVGADFKPLLATDGNQALVLTVSESGTVLSQLSRDGAPFVAGEPLKTGLQFLQLNDVVALPDGGWFTLGSGGSVERNGDTKFSYDPVAFRSADGLSWEPITVDGFSGPMEINDLATLDGSIVAAGSYRTASDPSMGGFEAHLWTSVDGESFSQVDLPDVPRPRGYGNDSSAGHLALVGDRLLAAGRVGRSAAIWGSDDGGTTWKRISSPVVDQAYDISGLAVVGDVLVAGIGESRVTAVRSADSGTTWSRIDSLPVSSEEAGWAPVWSDGTRFWTLTGVDDMSWSEPEVCYADLEQCGRSPEPQVVTSSDGAVWTAAELPGELDQIAGTSDGRALALSVNRRGVVVRTLPAGSAPLSIAGSTEPKRVNLVTLDEGQKPVIGKRYHAPMFVHCGMDWFWFGDGSWRRTDNGPDLETGAGDGPPDGWPLVGQVIYGYAVAVDADTVQYSIGDEVIARYQRAEGAPGCD